MKENSKVLKSAVVTNNVENGTTSHILLIEDWIEYLKPIYIVKNQMKNETQIYTFRFENYADAMKEFKRQMISASVL